MRGQNIIIVAVGSKRPCKYTIGDKNKIDDSRKTPSPRLKSRLGIRISEYQNAGLCYVLPPAAAGGLVYATIGQKPCRNGCSEDLGCHQRRPNRQKSLAWDWYTHDAAVLLRCCCNDVGCGHGSGRLTTYCGVCRCSMSSTWRVRAQRDESKGTMCGLWLAGFRPKKLKAKLNSQTEVWPQQHCWPKRVDNQPRLIALLVRSPIYLVFKSNRFWSKSHRAYIVFAI